jgi:crotonobetainyl-CoA:carnitine CoA-transferase CaiB-like acyl-CoA transferase
VSNGTTDYSLVPGPAQFDGAAPALRPAPEHGEHTDDVLRELGYDWETVTRLKVEGAVL